MINILAGLFKAEDGIYVIFGLIGLAAFLIYIFLRLLRSGKKDIVATEVRWLRQKWRGRKL